MNTLEVKTLKPFNTPFTLLPKDIPGGFESPEDAQISLLLGQTLRLRKVTKDANDKREFLKFFEKRERDNLEKKYK